MKLLLPIFLLISATFSVFAQSTKLDKDITSNYDRFKKQTVVQTALKDLKRAKDSKSQVGVMGYQAWCSFGGEKMLVEPQHFYLRFMAGPACDHSWCFIKSHTLRVLADGENYHIEDFPGKWEAGSSMDREYITYRLSRSELADMVNAKKLELQIGTFETAFDDNAREILKRLIKASTLNP
jgi:hypothetical protein